jgi:hypothetical protein
MSLKSNQAGNINRLVIPLVMSGVLFLTSTGFFIWAFLGRQDYKNNSDTKSAQAVAVAEKNLTFKKELEFNEREKKPTRDYRAPDAYGGVFFNYPKTWSVYADERGASVPVDTFMYPLKVPVTGGETAYALRVRVVNASYDNEVKSYESLVKTGAVKSSAFRPKLLPDQLGVRLEGEYIQKKKGVLILLPLRDKTLEISTEAPDFIADLDGIILNSLKYQP